MAKLKEEAEKYEKKKVKNIADLDVVAIDLDVKEETKVEYPYKYVELEGERYRIPSSVLESLKAVLEEKPELKKVKVKKIGEGLDSKYTVIPLI